MRVEMLSAGVAQIFVIVLGIGIADAVPELATVKFALVFWLVASAASTAAWFAASSRTNQQNRGGGGESLVSDGRGQLTAGPVIPVAFLTALIVAAIVAENFVTRAGPKLCQKTVRGCSSDPMGQFLRVGPALVAMSVGTIAGYYLRSRRGEGE